MSPFETMHFHGTKADFDKLLNDMFTRGYVFWGHMEALEGPGRLLIFKKA